MTIKKYILLSMSTLMLAGCTSEDISNSPAEERLPLRLEATLSGDRPVTRAAGSTIESTDELMSYVRHIYATDISTETDYSKYASVQASLVKFTTASVGTALYWDDFSNSEKKETDLRTSNHGLQSYYGYCYNGGTPSTALVETTGVLGWTIASDQSSAEALKNNDLLWSPSQKAVKYDHAKDAHGTLEVPFTHAMSKFTIVIVAGDGFKAGDLKETTVTLKDVKEKGTFTAPTGEISVTDDKTDVKMYSDGTDAATASTRSYEAMTVPQTALAEGNVLAVIDNAHGNSYEIKITDKILGTSNPVAANNWKDGLDEGKTKTGYNYKLTVTLNKQAVNVVATLADWTDVSADGTGEIQFTADVKDSGISNATSLANGDSFSLWMTKKGDEELKESDFGSIATTSEFNGSAFVNGTKIYWPNGSDYYYFRALAKHTDTKTLDAVTEKKATQGIDLLWGTTAAHIGYAESAAINPRTGDVPMVFKHTMSNVVIELKTTDDDASKVTLTDATVTLTYLYTDGTISIATGDIAHGENLTKTALDKSTSFDNLIMIPQTISNDAKLIVTLSDKTTYSLQLNQCKNGEDAISEWVRGNKYTYTITLQKEAMKFRALVEAWKKESGSGNATLDWD